MTLESGTRIGSYEILGPLGAGGMGEVYRARDTSLNREVAIKVLPEALATDPERLARFKREAEALAALNHPNIAQIYELEGTALVMELVDGDELAERIAGGPLRLAQALPIATQMAHALEVAHDRGVIHRDLKPANVKITPDGTVKLLDFGLAKMTELADEEADSGYSVPPTMTSPHMTEAGMVMGTTAYMSPEQATGAKLDRSTDVWSFGVVLFEMLSGRRPFGGDTTTHVMAAVLKDEPDWAALPPDVPARVRRLLRRCLDKKPRRRLRDLREAWVALEAEIQGRADEAQSVAAVAPPPAAGVSRRALTGITLLAVAGTVVVMQFGVQPFLTGGGEASLSLDAPRRVTFEGGLETRPSISPDGTQVAYSSGAASRMRVYIRSVTGGRPRPLSDDADPFEIQPAYSPTGESILFLTPSGAYRAPALGGPASPVARATGSGSTLVGSVAFPVSAAAWSPDGQQVFIARGGELSIASIAGGTEAALGTTVEDLHTCDWSPRGDWIACTSGNANAVIPGNNYGNIAPSSIALIRASNGELLEVTDRLAANQSPVWLPDGRSLLFVSDRQGTNDVYLLELGADGQVVEEPTRITTGLGAKSIALSADGTRVVYETYSATANLWSLPAPSPAMAPSDASSAQQLTSASQLIESVRVEPNLEFVVYDSNLSGNADIYRIPVDGGTPVRVVEHPADDFAPSVSPDGTELTYHSWRTGTRDVFVQPMRGGPAVPITATESQESYPRWSPDGRRLAFVDQLIEDQAPRGLYLIERADDGTWGQPARLRQGADSHFTWLPDSHQLAYVAARAIEIASVDSGDHRVVYQPTAAGDPRPESVEASAVGDALYFKSHDEAGRASIWSVPVEGGRPTLLVRFTDDNRPSLRPDFAAGAGRFFFTTEDRQSDVWVADLVRR